MTVQAGLFNQTRRSKRDLRVIKRNWQDAVEIWARGEVQSLLIQYADPDDESTYIQADGSGPPNNWHDRVLDGLASDYVAAGLEHSFLYDVSDPKLVKAAIRIGRLPRSIIESMPPKPPELA